MMATTAASSSSSSSIASKDKKKLEEKTSKMLREVAQLSHNKQCCDCNQKGPTYANITVGSFVCTTCSGVLRGLNPPHRIKSINMATFTPEEIEFLRNHGNHFCRLVYMSLFDSTTGVQPDSRDSEKLRDFLTQKYEKKRWYSAPSDAILNQIKRENEISAKIQQNTKSSPTTSHNSASMKAEAAITHSQQRPHTQRGIDSTKIVLNFNKPSHNNGNNLMTSFDQLSISSNSSGGTINNTNFNFNNFAANFSNLSPGASSQKAAETAPNYNNNNSNFANFDMFDQFADSSNQTNASATSANFNAFSSIVPQPVVQATSHNATTTPNNHVAPAAFAQSKASPLNSDKYSALAELDNIFQPHGAPTPAAAAPPQHKPASSTGTNLFSPNANPFGQQHFATASFQTQTPTPTMQPPSGSMFFAQPVGSAMLPASNQHSYYPHMSHTAAMFAPQSPTGHQASRFSLSTNQFFAAPVPINQPYQHQHNSPQAAPVNNPFISIAQQQSQVLKPKSNSSNPFL